jgi:ribosome-associated protein
MTIRTPSRRPTPPAVPQLKLVKDTLEDMKAVDIRLLDVRGISDVTDYMVIASGTSDRHVKSIADRVVQQSKAAGVRPFGIEGDREGEWVLVDLPDVMVHVMLPRVREFYALEQLWEPPSRPAAEPGAGAARPQRKPARKGKVKGKPASGKAGKVSARSAGKPRGKPRAGAAAPRRARPAGAAAPRGRARRPD